MRVLVGILTLLVATTALALGLAFAFGGLTRAAALTALAGGMAAGFFAARGTRDIAAAPPWGFWDGLVLGAFVLASFRAFFWLYYPVGNELLALSPNNLGDLSLHIGLIRNLASGVAFWPESPIFAGIPLVYPLGADLFNAACLLAGWDLRSGLIATGFVVALCGGLALRAFGGTFGLAAFLFGGGLAGFVALRTGVIQDYSDAGIWKNPFLAMLVTQRGFLFALPITLLALTDLQERFFRGRAFLPRWVSVLFYGFLPLFHVHAFLFVSFLLALALWLTPNSRRDFSLLLALPVAALCAYFVTGGCSMPSFLRFDPLWAMPRGLPAFLLEFGPVLSLTGWLVLSFWRRPSTPEERWLAIGGITVGAAAFLLPLHPWAWDNTKFLIWSWIVLAPCLWTRILSPLPLAPRAALCALLFLSGAISLVGGLDGRHGYFLASRKELADWDRATRDLPVGTVFGASPEYNHPLLLLGKGVSCGYEGHLFSHGMDYAERLRNLRIALSVPPDWQHWARRADADYLALREKESPTGQLLLLPVHRGN